MAIIRNGYSEDGIHFWDEITDTEKDTQEYRDSDGWHFYREFNREWDNEIPYYVIEWRDGAKVYEREGNMELFPVKRKVFIRNHPKEELQC